ncbi:H(+)/Cl(-) exchange transporter 7-like isoform X2 [Lineus longissimus]|uniref:H(+)/Cl(-) exchange transporter 7-like isoform X2 n=1 Tax=Lineus longissimus TaxID=88925 RepID=UPI002B4F66A9
MELNSSPQSSTPLSSHQHGARSHHHHSHAHHRRRFHFGKRHSKLPMKGFHGDDLPEIHHEDDAGHGAGCCGKVKDEQKGRDFASVFTNHRYTEAERKVLLNFTSLDYLPSYSEAYKKWLKEQPNRLDWDRWVMMGLIGCSIGIVGFFLHQVVEIIAEVKWEHAEEFLHHNGIGVAYGWVLGYSLVFVGVSSASVAFIYPAAAGSGIPEIIGFLNGTVVRYAFNLKQLVITFFSCVCAVGGGLPVGPEGPMIHMGSIIGGGLSQFRSRTLKFVLPAFERFRNPEDRRNFTSAGAAAGVASAFGAPVGGLLFAMEEVSSFWSVKLGWMIFFCCMIATFTTDLLNSGFGGFHYSGSFGLFQPEKYILFRVTKAIPVNLMMFMPAVVLGIMGGVLGALFTVLNLKIRRIRRLINSKIKNKHLEKLNKFCETIVIMILMATASVFLPMAFNCQPRSCEIMESNATDAVSAGTPAPHVAPASGHHRVGRSAAGHGAPAASHGSHGYETPDTNATRRTTINERGFTSDISSAVIYDRERGVCLTDADHPIKTGHVVSYVCAKREMNGSKIIRHGEYNEVATLFFCQGAMAVKHLFTRTAHYEFGYTSLIAVLIIYFLLACWAAGSSVSSGIVVPMLMIGGLYGRIIGLVTLDIYGGKVPTEVFWGWIDPGAMALIGGASFFGGVSRLTLSLTVIMIEITNDVQFLLPIMTAIMVSKWVGDQITHPLYHSMLELKCIPFLDSEPVVFHDHELQNLEFYEARHIMRKTIVVLRTKETIQDLANLILNTNYGGFPVVHPDGEYGFEVDYGYITRIELTVILYQSDFWKYSEDGLTVTSECPYTEVCVDRIMEKQRARRELAKYSSEAKWEHIWIDLARFVNKSSPTIPEHFSLHRTYILFRTLGLRHLTIVNQRNQVVGVISRKDLMGFNLEETLEALREKENEPKELIVDTKVEGIEGGIEPLINENNSINGKDPRIQIDGQEVLLRPRRTRGKNVRMSRDLTRELNAPTNVEFDGDITEYDPGPYMDSRVSSWIDSSRLNSVIDPRD